MVVRNEEAKLLELLTTARDHVDEIIVVDTGSEDATVELARSQGARVLSLPTRDLAAARNHAMDAARGDWLVWPDADERLDAGGWAELVRLSRGQPAIYRCWIANYFGRGGWTPTRRIGKVFARRSEVRWHGAFHESILPSLPRAGIPVRDAVLVFHHLETLPPDDSEAKRWRNVERVRGELVEGGDSPRLRRLLSLDLHALGDLEGARRECERGLTMAPDDVHLHEQLGFFLLATGEHEAAQEQLERSLLVGEGLADRLALGGLARIAMARGELERAEGLVRRAAEGDRGAHHAINLALLEEARGRDEQARVCWQEALRRNPMLLDERVHGERLRASTYPPRCPLLPGYFERARGSGFWRQWSS